MKKIILILLIISSANFHSKANVVLPEIFGNHMVLQQNSEVKIWGWAKAGEPVHIKASWLEDTLKTKADPNSNWLITMKTPSAGGAYTIYVKGYNEILLEDVLIGEVWFASGQSNMEWSARMGIDNAEKEVSAANYPKIRFFNVLHRTADSPQLDIKGEWTACTPETMVDFSAVAYFFGRKLNKDLNIPIGLINSSWGGTPAEVWVDPEVIEQDPILKADALNIKKVPWCPVEPGKTFHAMVSPLTNFKIAGALWYQGETNTYSPDNYAILLPALVSSWREKWGYDFPFYFVQIAPFPYGDNYAGVRLRDAQRRSLKIPNTGMVVVSDIGNINDIHPTNKQDVGLRLANLALHKNYGKKELVYSGPLYKEMKIEGRKIRLSFDHAENGLICKGEKLTWFEISGEGGEFYPADAKIEGNTVVVTSKNVKKPVAVRFAWNDTAEPNLFNKEGLPASCFRTDHNFKVTY